MQIYLYRAVFNIYQRLTSNRPTVDCGGFDWRLDVCLCPRLVMTF